VRECRSPLRHRWPALGTNDFKGFNRTRYVDDYRRTIEALNTSAPRPRVVVMSPPPALAARWNIKPEIVDDAIPGAAREVAAAVGAHFFDLHRWFSAAAGCLPRTPACATHFTPDGIHTNEKGTALIAKLARRALAETCIVPGECIPSLENPHVCKPCVPVIS